ncbi:MAG: hypothetical protein H8F28_26775 [Fibrella sp.]|nr:hypothetical protein [Armatimonadota bacterium]
MTDAPTPAVCANCGRAETRPTVRICPNCGAVLPGLTGARVSHAGFAALAQQLPPQEAPPIAAKEPSPEPTSGTTQPWVIHPASAPNLHGNFAPLEDDLTGPFLTKSLRGDRVLGFIGEVAAVAFGVGILLATGEAANQPNLPNWTPGLVFVGGMALFTLCLWQAKRMRETYPQLARGWYAGRSIWENTILPFIVGGAVVGLVLLVLGPLGLLAICVGSVFIMALGPLAWLLLAMFVFVIGRMIIFAIRKRRDR